jgi:hypothetical protein
MNNRFELWLTRLFLAIALFLGAVAVSQTTIIILVLTKGQDVQLRDWGIHQKNYFELSDFDHHSMTVSFRYHYCLDGQSREGKVKVKAVEPTSPPVTYGLMPMGYMNGGYRLRVWDMLPTYPIPLLQDYNPFWSTLPFWGASLVSFLAWLTVRSILKHESPDAHSLSRL